MIARTYIEHNANAHRCLWVNGRRLGLVTIHRDLLLVRAVVISGTCEFAVHICNLRALLGLGIDMVDPVEATMPIYPARRRGQLQRRRSSWSGVRKRKVARNLRARRRSNIGTNRVLPMTSQTQLKQSNSAATSLQEGATY